MADDSEQQRTKRTRLIAVGRSRPAGKRGSAVNIPPTRASTIAFDSVAALRAASKPGSEVSSYALNGTDTHIALEAALGALEPGAEGTQLYGSGLAAIAGVMGALLAPGDEVLVPDAAYGPTRVLCDRVLARQGIAVRYYDPLIGADIAEMIGEATRLVWMESPGSQTFEVQDVPAIAAAAKAAGAYAVIDNSYASGLLFRGLDHGCDISVVAGTKYIAGHADAMLGLASGKGRAWQLVRRHARATGQQAGSEEAWLALRGVRTLGVRLAAHETGAIEVAAWLAGQRGICAILHPAFETCPGHAIWKRDFSGSNGLFSFVLEGASAAQRDALVDALTLFGIGYSWGGYQSLALPVDPVRTASSRDFGGPLVRLHIGLEDPADLIADLERGLEAARLCR